MGLYSKEDGINNYNSSIKVEEVINHICGTCGDAHPSLITFPALLVAIGGYFSYIKCQIKSLWKKED